MATVQLTLSDDEGERVKKQAQKEGITEEAWLTAAVLDRLRLREEVSYLGTGRRFESAEELQEFWKRCDAMAGPEPETGLDGVLLRDVLPPERREKRFESAEELQEFWKRCAAVAGPGREPDWEEHLKAINESRSKGLPDV